MHQPVICTSFPCLKPNTITLNNNLELLGKIRDQFSDDPFVMVRVDNKFIRVTLLLTDKEEKSKPASRLPADGLETKALSEGKSYIGLSNQSGAYYVSVFELVLRNNDVVASFSLASASTRS